MLRSEKEALVFDSRKKGTLYLAMVGIWLLIVAGSVNSLWNTFIQLNSLLAQILFIPFVICLTGFWFFGVYHVVFLVFSYLRKPEILKGMLAVEGEASSLPRVAIIYATFNDFNREAVKTCFGQDYPNYHLFILDVSTNPDMRKQVDAFCEEFASSTTLVRLQPRQGFKARSLNDTLKTAVGEEYKFFAVCDADNIWPTDFLSRMIPYLLVDERIAFVQASHKHNPNITAKFAKDFEVAVDASWSLHQRPRDKYGILMCMGHSVVVRREAWEKVGGYPEIVQEDTAFSMRLRGHGYYGLFAKEVVCQEEFPEDYSRWRRRQYRLVQADAEILFTQMPGFLKNRGISFVEKLDILARSKRLPAQALTLPFLLLALLLIPLANGGGLSAASIDRAYSAMLSPWLVAVTLLTAAAPLYPFVVYLRRKPVALIAFLLRGLTLHYTPLVLTFSSFLVYILRGSAMFLVTGAQGSATTQSQPSGVVRNFLQRLNPNGMFVTTLDIVVGLVIGYVGVVTGGLVLLGIASVLLLSPVMCKLGWHNKLVSVLVFLPPTLLIAGLVTSLSGGTGAVSQYLALAVLSILLF
ncbi:MAG: glycosyltransferase family 2 protein [Chloroflexota bacterium]